MRAAGYPHGLTIDVATNSRSPATTIVDVLGALDAQLVDRLAVTCTRFVDNTDQLLALEARTGSSRPGALAPLLGGPACSSSRTPTRHSIR